ncbi:hypothetical protein ILUMI_17333 [Ignelater luminosus]|uniref:Alpha 1,4-glycosyltransferase domain-containing protein n=1 Tax=Ignelater luminosus TaxID=2038154 RepID=A0A8K0G1Z8_IGNLU|nr:hypothetical protein ILUMI_17333 [Ignelater luminosus]
MLKLINFIIRRCKQILIVLFVISAVYVITIFYVMQPLSKNNVNISNTYTILEHVETGINHAKKYFHHVSTLIRQDVRKQGLLGMDTTNESAAVLTNVISVTPKSVSDHSNYGTKRLNIIFPNVAERQFATRPLECYSIHKESLSDISDINSPKSRSIFFLETSCTSHIKGRIALTSRQACAVESAARMNPNLDVYVLFVSPGIVKYAGTESDKFLTAILSYKNVKLHHLDFKRYLQDTPLEDILESGKLEWSSFPVTHASDILRFITLWKYGGIYMDLDIVTLKSLESLAPNFVVLETFTHSAAGVIGFTATGDGHRFAEFCINDLKLNFRGHSWNQNGPLVATRLIESMCKTKITKNILNKTCNGLKVYPPEVFYPISGFDLVALFNASFNGAALNVLSNSYGIHVWNTLSKHLPIYVKTSNVSYAILAKKYCPKVFQKCKTLF